MNLTTQMDISVWLKLLAIGLVTGLVNGLLGIGGGTILIPCMVFFLGISQHQAHGTSLAIILPTALVSSIIYSLNSDLDLKLSLQVALGGMTGGYLGARLMNHIPAMTLKKFFAVFMFLAGLRMVL
ncbi:MAG: sulfite exporter TauE/SafE family protein [Bacillota bacterium]